MTRWAERPHSAPITYELKAHCFLMLVRVTTKSCNMKLIWPQLYERGIRFICTGILQTFQISIKKCAGVTHISGLSMRSPLYESPVSTSIAYSVLIEKGHYWK